MKCKNCRNDDPRWPLKWHALHLWNYFLTIMLEGKEKNDILVQLLTTITEDKIRVEDYWEKIVPLYSDSKF